MKTKMIQKRRAIFTKKTLAVILAGVFLFTNTFCWAKEEELFSAGTENTALSSGPADNSKLAPPSKLNSEEFKSSLTVAAICKHIEHDGNLDDKSYLNDVLARLDTGKNPNITVLPYEIIIEIPNENLAVRYFDPTKANVITPYSDISKLMTKIIGPRLNRQIIYRIKALPDAAVEDIFTLRNGSRCHVVPVNQRFVQNRTDELLEVINNMPGARKWNKDELLRAHPGRWIEHSYCALNEAGMIIAFITAQEEGSNAELGIDVLHIFVMRLYTVEAYRGQGLATILLHTLAIHTPQDESIALDVEVTNDHANNLYRRLGFNLVSTTTGDRHDNIYMIKAKDLAAITQNQISEYYPSVVATPTAIVQSGIIRHNAIEVETNPKITQHFEAVLNYAGQDSHGIAAMIVDAEGRQLVLAGTKEDTMRKTMGLPHIHAEINAIREANARGLIDWENYTLITSLENCNFCSQAIINMGIKKVVILALDPELTVIKAGALSLPLVGVQLTIAPPDVQRKALSRHYKNAEKCEGQSIEDMLRIAEEPVSLWGASNINDMKKRARALLVSQPLNEIDERNAFWDFNRTIAYLLRGEQLNGNILPQVIAINANTFDTSVKLWKGPSVVTPRTYLNYHILRAAEAAVTSRPFYILISGNDENCHKLLSCIENNPELATLRNRVFILSDLRPNQKITLTSAAEFETKMAVEIEYIGKVYYFINNEWQLIRRDLRNTLALTTSIAQRVGLSQNRIALLKDATIKHELCDREPVLRKKLFLLKEDGTPNYDHRDFDFIDERYIEKRWRGISQDELLLIQYRNCYTRFIEDRRANRIKAGSLSLDDIQLMLEVAKVSDDFETANDATKKRARGKYDRTTGRINPEPFGAAISWITGKYPELVGNPALKALIDLIGEEDPIIMNAIIDLRSPRDLVADAIYYQGGLDKDDRLFIETHRISTVTLVENSIRWRRYLTKNADLFANIFGEDKTTTLIRVPVEAIESVGIDNIKNFLTTFQTAPNGYVELYYISSTGEVTESVYQKYGLAKKALPKDFKRTRENTVTLFSALKGEELDQSAILSRLGSLDISPQDSILSPIGLQHDPAGLIRATILGLKIMDLARQIKEGHGAYLIEGHVDRDKVQSEILEQVKNVCDQEALKNINLTPDDIIALAIGNINNIISALKKLIKLLPITPINAEELRQIYEHAKAVITAA